MGLMEQNKVYTLHGKATNPILNQKEKQGESEKRSRRK